MESERLERRHEEEEGGRKELHREMKGREREREGEGRSAWKVGSFAAGSNDPGCIDSWGCRAVVRVVVDGARGGRERKR